MTTPDLQHQGSGRSLVWLGVVAIAVFVAMVCALGWASGLTGGKQGTGRAIDFASNSIALSITNDPPQLDSTRMQDTQSGFVLGHVMEGLLRPDGHNQIVGGVADQWEIRPSGAMFHLRANARWSDGKPVTAHDFVFAWRLLVDPANGAPYATLIYPIRNAEAINTGKAPLESLGVKALSDSLLEVEFERPVPYFDKLAAFTSLLPIREDFYRSRRGRYAADANDLLFNGPFILADRVHGASFRFEKNPTYWDSKNVKLDAIDVPYITNDLNALLNLYRDGRTAMVGQTAGLGSESLKQALLGGWPLHQMRDGSVWYLQLNHRPGHLTANRNFRKALQLAIDRNELVYRVLKTPGYLPAASLFPVWLQGARGLFRQEHPATEIQVNVEEARRYLEMARRELGLSEFPPISYLSDDTTSAVKQGEYIQTALKESLGLDVRVDLQIFKQRIAKMQAGEFDLVSAGWGPDYDDPLTFADLFASWNPNNHGRYANTELDKWVTTAQRSIDPETRMAAFAEIQRILIDDAVIITNYERGQSYVQDPRLKGVVRRAIGTDPDFTNAYIVPD